MFGTTTLKQLPEYLYTSYAAWDAYMGNVWAHLLSCLGCPKQGSIIEVAPGTSTKIALALKALQFKGRLYVVEPQAKALNTLIQHYQFLLPQAEIYPIAHPLNQSMDFLPFNADFLLSNHPLDDMLMFFPYANKNLSPVFEWTNKPSKHITASFKRHWQVLQSDKAALDTAKKTTVQVWKHILLKRVPRTTVISQYPSSALEEQNLGELNHQASAILNRLRADLGSWNEEGIQALLNQMENYNNQHIGMNVLNAKNWWVHVFLGNEGTARKAR